MNFRVLVVDDNPTNLKLTVDVLESGGYEVLSAVDAETAAEVVRSGPPSLILMDIGLPGMDGLSLTRLLKSHPETQNIRILALTAFAMKGDEEKAMNAGCDGYLSKPIDIRMLLNRVESERQFLESGQKEEAA